MACGYSASPVRILNRPLPEPPGRLAFAVYRIKDDCATTAAYLLG